MPETTMFAELEFTDEVKILCSINDRFDYEPEPVKQIRLSYAHILDRLTKSRDKAGRSPAGRDINIAITHTEDACIREVKAFWIK